MRSSLSLALSCAIAGAASAGTGAAPVLSTIIRDAALSRIERHARTLASGSHSSPVIHTTSGDLVGVDDGSVVQFLGVPFAAAPVGDFRWKAPQPVQPWSSPRNATFWGPACPQAGNEWYWGIPSGIDEDCLFLNVYAPSPSKAGPPPAGGYPMLLFFYGGSWAYGSANFPLYDGFFDVNATENVIIATTNYRLNVFGFLTGDDFLAESPDGAAGNMGLQDQRAALQFLIDNAGSGGFNIDKTRVTIFGESAGAASVSNHLVSPRSWGLFTRAAMESGSFAAWTAQPYNISKTRGPQMAANLNCSGLSTGAARLACMRAVPWQAVDSNQDHLTSGFIEWSPTIDGVEVVGDPRELVAAGRVAKVPTLFGSNFDEGTLFTSAPHDLNATGYPAALAAVVGSALAPSILQYYPPDLYNATLAASAAWWSLSHALGDAQMTCAARQTARWLSNSTGQPVHTYFYTHVLEIVEAVDVFDPLGCSHASELVMVWGLAPALVGPGEADLARVFLGYWTQFAITGDPNGGGYPTWPDYGGASADLVAVIDTSADGVSVTPVTGLKKALCDFWETVAIPPSIVFG